MRKFFNEIAPLVNLISVLLAVCGFLGVVFGGSAQTEHQRVLAAIYTIVGLIGAAWSWDATWHD